MLIVGERINSSRKAIYHAIQARDADFIRSETQAQVEAGADYIDVNSINNVSFQLPARKLLNRTFLVAAMSHGLDSTIIDPTDHELMASLIAAEALTNRAEFCLKYIKAYRTGRLS